MMAKRHSVFEHLAKDLEVIGVEVAARSVYLSPESRALFEIALEKKEIARVRIDDPDGADHVGAFVSAAQNFTVQYAATGLKVKSGGNKGRERGGRSIDENRLSICRKWIENNQDQSRGRKAKLARYLAETCGISEDNAQKFIQRHYKKIVSGQRSRTS